MKGPKQRGETTEAIVLAELMRRHIPVLVPFGESQRYDFVIDIGGRFYRLQCKSGRYEDGVVRFTTISTRPRGTGYSKEDYRGDIDYFVVHVRGPSRTYLVPIEEAPRNEMNLRIAPPKNNQKDGINWAADYRLDARLAEFEDYMRGDDQS